MVQTQITIPKIRVGGTRPLCKGCQTGLYVNYFFMVIGFKLMVAKVKTIFGYSKFILLNLCSFLPSGYGIIWTTKVQQNFDSTKQFNKYFF